MNTRELLDFNPGGKEPPLLHLLKDIRLPMAVVKYT